MDWFANIDSSDWVAIFSVAAGILLAAVVIVANQWRRVRQAEIDAGLKHEMIQRGMSADEIERVLKASPRRRHKGCSEAEGRETAKQL